MDKVSKLLNKLTATKRQKIKNLIQRILNNKLEDLDCKKLRGFRDFYRIRKGDIRIIFKKNNRESLILYIEKRNEKTYKKI